MNLPRGSENCGECHGVGWLEPSDLPNDSVLAHLGLEPCFECGAMSGVEAWYEKNRSRVAADVAA